MTLTMNRVLKYRLPMMSGDDVEAVQKRLVALGYGMHSDVDGLYGPGTRDRVARFQAAAGLGPSGVVDAETARKLNDTAAAPRTAPRGGRHLRSDWLPRCRMKRIIVHWSAGGHIPSKLDRKHYHFLIDGSGGVHRGLHSVEDNVATRDRKYAAHTRGTNTGSIGVAVCAMAGASERPFNPGSAPMTEEQWNTMAEVVAELCTAYDIPCRPDTVLGHGEVQAILGRPQSGKWDPLILPWQPSVSRSAAGQLFRDRVQAAMSASAGENEEALPEDTVLVDGRPVAATRFDAHDWLDLDDLARQRGWGEVEVEDGLCRVDDPPALFRVTEAEDRDGRIRPWVDVAEVSELLELEITTADDGQVSLRAPKAAPARAAAPAEGPVKVPKPVVVFRGDTLTRIAARHLGDPGRWREITDEHGVPFDEKMARSLSVGQVVLLPETPDTPAGPAVAAAEPAEPPDEQIGTLAAAIGDMAPAWMKASQRQRIVEAAAAILAGCRRHRISDPSHVAYVLATADHETNLGIHMVEIWRDTPAQQRYARILGNRGLEDARLYSGRGFVQLTGRSNYARYGRLMGLPLEDDPSLVEDPDTAADILVCGMAQHGFTSPRRLLSTYGFDHDFSFFDARDIINGDKHRTTDQRYRGKSIGTGVAEKAMEFRQVLTQS